MMDADETYWRLSFVDPSAPAGHRWLGGTLVTGRDIVQAVKNAWRLNVNPGGDVLGSPVLADDVPGLSAITAGWSRTRTSGRVVIRSPAD